MKGLAVLVVALMPAASPAAEPGGREPAGEVRSSPATAEDPVPAPARAADGSRQAEDRSRESVASLLADGPGGTAEADRGGRGILFRMIGWVAAIAVGALAAVRIWKRMAVTARPGGADGGGLRVVGRTSLTPRHSLYAVRVGNARLIVVGVSGDRISALAEIDDPAQVVALDPSFRTALEKAGGPEGPAVREGGGGLDEKLSSYRSEVQRLREMVRGWRGKLGRGGAAREAVGSGRRSGA
jgi:flagellar biogenesis protein FliO